MNPYNEFSELLFTCVDGPKTDIVATVLAGFNEPDEWNARNSHGEPIIEYFVKETGHSFSLAYVNKAERDGTKPQRVLFWEPRIHPGKTVVMGVFHDGLSHSIFRLSEDSPYTWINIRIYDDEVYPSYFFDYYANHRRIQRRLMASKDEEGWEFVEKGPVQSFENTTYYTERLIKDRLNRKIISEYMAKVGFMITQDDFWQTDKPASFLWQERPNEDRGR